MVHCACPVWPAFNVLAPFSTIGIVVVSGPLTRVGKPKGSSAVPTTPSGPGGKLIVPETLFTTRFASPGVSLVTYNCAEKNCFRYPTFPGITKTLGILIAPPPFGSMSGGAPPPAFPSGPSSSGTMVAGTLTPKGVGTAGGNKGWGTGTPCESNTTGNEILTTWEDSCNPMVN